MAKAAMKNRIKKMNFQKQEREMNVTPLSDNDKYVSMCLDWSAIK